MTTKAEEIEERAAGWVVRRDRRSDDPLTPAEQAEFASWMAITRHAAVYRRIHSAWERSGALRVLRPLDGHVDPDLLAGGRLP